MISLKWIKSFTNFYCSGQIYTRIAFNYSYCGSFTKNRKRIQKLRETGNLKHLYKNE